MFGLLYILYVVFVSVAGIVMVIIVGAILIIIVMSLVDRLFFAPDYFERTLCQACAMPFGKDCIRAAKRKRLIGLQQWRRDNPGVKLRLDRRLHLMCTHCGAPWLLDYESKRVQQPTAQSNWVNETAVIPP